MRLLLAIFLPWLQFFTIGRPLSAIFCLVLQLSIFGWVPAAIWSVYALSQYETEKNGKSYRCEKFVGWKVLLIYGA